MPSEMMRKICVANEDYCVLEIIYSLHQRVNKFHEIISVCEVLSFASMISCLRFGAARVVIKALTLTELNDDDR
jgi:hypothetical protein